LHSLGGYDGGYWRRRAWIYDLQRGGSVHWWQISREICYEWLQVRGVKNPKGFGFYLKVNRWLRNGQMDMYR
jgi:hypothetical protein